LTRYIVRRLLLSIPVLIGIVFLVFALARLLPGDPCFAALGEHASEAKCAIYREAHGLNEPIPVQFAVYVGEIARGDFGMSTKYGVPVQDILLERLPLTVELTVSALFIAIIVGIPLGVLSAVKRNSLTDVVTMIFANLGVSTPIFVLGLLLAFLFAVILKGTPFALPPSGRLSPGMDVYSLAELWGLTSLSGPPRLILDFLSNIYMFNGIVTLNWTLFFDAFRHILLPALALATIPLAIIARITRSSLLDVMGLDYIRTARAKGIRERTVVLRHGLSNALLPVVTIIGLQLGGLLAGAVLTETIFNLGGVGRAIFEAIQGRDYVIVQTFTLFVAVGYVVINLLVDLSYGLLDPRVRLQ
jgi:peptide/nickel transport system permease protein